MVGRTPGEALTGRARARLVLFLGELRGWRLMHEPDYMGECLCCGEPVRIEEEMRGRRLWKIHLDPRALPADADCLEGSRVPPRWSLRAFDKLGLSAPLRRLEELTEPVRTGYCPECGMPIDRFCHRHGREIYDRSPCPEHGVCCPEPAVVAGYQ